MPVIDVQLTKDHVARGEDNVIDTRTGTSGQVTRPNCTVTWITVGGPDTVSLTRPSVFVHGQKEVPESLQGKGCPEYPPHAKVRGQRSGERNNVAEHRMMPD